MDEGAGLPEPDFLAVFDETPAPLLLLTPDLRIVHANRARLEATATTLQGTVGRHLFDVFPINPQDPAADGMVNLRASLERVRDTGRAETMQIQKYDIPMPGGGYVERYWSPRNVPVLDRQGRVAFLLHRADDITDYVRDRDDARLEAARGARWRERAHQVEADLFTRTRELEALNAELRSTAEQERRTARRLAGLAATVSALAAADTTEELCARLFRHGCPAMGADALVLALRRPDRAVLALTDGLGGRFPAGDGCLPVGSPLPVAAAARGERLLARDEAESAAHGAEAARVFGSVGLVAWAALPLRAGGQLLGSLTPGWAQPRSFDAEELDVLEAFAAQCAQAVERTGRLETERRRASDTRTLAETLQRSMLTDVPQPDHLQIAVRYRPAASGAHVGGDWYDAFLDPDGCTTLVVGDVTGHDRAAAGLRRLRWSNAGHLPPLLLEPGGRACWSSRGTCCWAWRRSCRARSTSRRCTRVGRSSCTRTAWWSGGRSPRRCRCGGCATPPPGWRSCRWRPWGMRCRRSRRPTRTTTSRSWRCAPTPRTRRGRTHRDPAPEGRPGRPGARTPGPHYGE
ncbi:hypothetical protein NUM3379_39280 [Kineococcus sp. NUM-3379]